LQALVTDPNKLGQKRHSDCNCRNSPAASG
jgi:hypothetical protein